MPRQRHLNLARRFNAGEAVGKVPRRASDAWNQPSLARRGESHTPTVV